MTLKDVKDEAKSFKKKFPDMFFGSYKMPGEIWQCVVSSGDKNELEEDLKYQAKDQDYFLF